MQEVTMIDPRLSALLFGLAVFLSVAAATAPAQPSPSPASRSGRCYALLVGISDYQYVRKLGCAKNDALALKAVLEDATLTGGYEVCTLVDRDATQRRIVKELAAIASKAGPGDTVLVHFSGHGMRVADEFFLVPADAEEALISDHGISLGTLFKKLHAVPADRKIVFLDACHSGGLATMVLASARAGANTAKGADAGGRLNDLMARSGKGIYVMMSSSGDEVSWEDEANGLGYFTEYLVKGLKGEADGRYGAYRGNGDGQVSADELYQYVYHRANDAVRKDRELTQRAQEFKSTEGVLLLSRLPVAPSPPPATETASPAARLAGPIERRLLVYRFDPPDEPVRHRLQMTTTTRNMAPGGKSTAYTSVMVMDLEQRLVRKRPGGEFEIATKITRAEQNIDGRPVKAQVPLGKRELLTMKPNGRILEGSSFLAQMQMELSDEPVGETESWVQLGKGQQGMPLDTRTRYTVEKLDTELVGYAGRVVQLKASLRTEKQQLPSGETVFLATDGQVWFDGARGRVVRSQALSVFDIVAPAPRPGVTPRYPPGRTRVELRLDVELL